MIVQNGDEIPFGDGVTALDVELEESAVGGEGQGELRIGGGELPLGQDFRTGRGNRGGGAGRVRRCSGGLGGRSGIRLPICAGGQ